MNIIEQLEQTVTTALLKDDNNIAYISLLEQFYAILITRLAAPDIYNQLVAKGQSSQSVPTDNTLFKQIWPVTKQRRLLIEKLATTYHVAETTTNELVANATQLSYQILTEQADNQFLPAYLQQQQPAVRQYLPVWTTAVVEDATIIDGIDSDLVTSEIRVNPSAYHDSETGDITPTRNLSTHSLSTRSLSNDLIVRLALIVIALVALALLWFLVIEPRYMTVAKPMKVQSKTPASDISTNKIAPATVAMPAELIVAVDDSGNLYSCMAKVGDINLQKALNQALRVSFGEQADSCELTVQSGIEVDLSGVDTQVLPDLFTIVRAVPFARLHLQNAEISLAAPDAMSLQQLVNNVQTLLPTMTITTAAPIPLSDANNTTAINANEIDDSSLINERDDEFNDVNNNANIEYQESDDDTDDRVTFMPTRNNYDNSSTSNLPPSGPISLSEADDIANSIIVSEPAQGGRPIER